MRTMSFTPWRSQLARIGKGAGLGHAGRALGADVLQHQHVVGGHVQVVAVDARGQVGGVLEDHGAAFVFHQRRVGGRLLDDGAARRQVAAQHGDAALRGRWGRCAGGSRPAQTVRAHARVLRPACDR
jgi:hypothetical protein